MMRYGDDYICPHCGGMVDFPKPVRRFMKDLGYCVLVIVVVNILWAVVRIGVFS